MQTLRRWPIIKTTLVACSCWPGKILGRDLDFLPQQNISFAAISLLDQFNYPTEIRREINPHQTRNPDPMLLWCWPIVCDAVPTSNQQVFKIPGQSGSGHLDSSCLDLLNPGQTNSVRTRCLSNGYWCIGNGYSGDKHASRQYYPPTARKDPCKYHPLSAGNVNPCHARGSISW